MLPLAGGALTGTLTGGAGSNFTLGNAGPSATGDSILGPFDFTSGTVNFAPFGGSATSSQATGTGASAGGVSPLLLAAMGLGALWVLSKK